MNEPKKTTGRGRPAGLRVAAVEVHCQDCGTFLTNPSSGLSTWSVAEYSNFRHESRGRVLCPECGNRIDLGGVVFDVVRRDPQQPNKEPST